MMLQSHNYILHSLPLVIERNYNQCILFLFHTFMFALASSLILGAYFDLRNAFTSHFECIWDKLNDISVKLQNIKFNQTNAIKCYNHFIIPKTAFGCIVIDIDREEIVRIKENVERMMIRSLKTPEKTSKKSL